MAVSERPCPGAPTLNLARPAPPHWENARLHFNPAARHPTEAQRAEVLRRDCYACSTPGCPNHLWLAVHHVVFYCLGGVTLPANLIAVCTRCHRNIHQGRLKLSGSAPDRLVWRDAQGRALIAAQLGGWFECCWELDLAEP